MDQQQDEDDRDSNQDPTTVLQSDSEVLETTAKIYIPLFFGLTLLFCYVRLRFPKVYNVRGWLPRLRCELATTSQQFGFVGWMWRVFQIPEQDFLEQCGMDALCLVRAQGLGLKLSLLGIVMSIWLMPVYATAPESEATQKIDDAVVQLTAAYVPKGSSRLLATVLAAYLLHLYAMYLILRDFRWFTATRVQFLAQPQQPRNYTVYVSNIRKEYKSDAALANYFRRIFSPEAVLEAHVAVTLSRLEQKVESRRLLVEKLEHAINVQQIKGETPMHRIELVGEMVNSIDVYQRQLEEMNREISDAVTRLELLELRTSTLDAAQESRVHMNSVLVGRSKEGNSHDEESFSYSIVDTKDDSQKEGAANQENLIEESQKPLMLGLNTMLPGSFRLANEASQVLLERAFRVSHMLNSSGRQSSAFLSDQTASLTGSAVNVSHEVRNASYDALIALIPKDKLMRILEIIPGLSPYEDGEPLCGGFVTFTTLTAATVSKQMLHSNMPFEMEVTEAPTPEGIVWGNVGRQHESVQMGRLISFGISATLCIFWTVPVSFITSLTSVDSLKNRFSTIEDWIENAPWVEAVLQQLAPILLWLLMESLYVILDIVVKMEGHVGVSTLEASLFAKLSAFHIIQTFFVAAIAGSLTSGLVHVVKDLADLIRLLAITLPPQSTFFIQYLLVSTIIGLAFEMLRITQVWQEQVRKRVWWNLTEKEANKKWKFLRPLGDPRKFFHARVFAANTMLPFIICFVYAPLAPLTCYFLAFCFLVQSAAFRHQFIYIYPTVPDSGGRLWMSSVHVLIACMLVAQITLCAYLVLKQAPVAAPLTVPLIIITVLFAVYIQQRHFHTARYLSSEDCLKYDHINKEEGMDFEFVRGKYRNPAMNDKILLPDNLPMAPSSVSQNETNGNDEEVVDSVNTNGQSESEHPT